MRVRCFVDNLTQYKGFPQYCWIAGLHRVAWIVHSKVQGTKNAPSQRTVGQGIVAINWQEVCSTVERTQCRDKVFSSGTEVGV